MLESIWILEYRFRSRKNGKWSEWTSMDNVNRIALTAFSQYPAEDVFAHEKYERRAIEFKRESCS